jgi:hypothetical protein
MPRVSGSKRHFPYSAKGRKAAKRLAKKTGKRVMSRGYRAK